LSGGVLGYDGDFMRRYASLLLLSIWLCPAIQAAPRRKPTYFSSTISAI